MSQIKAGSHSCVAHANRQTKKEKKTALLSVAECSRVKENVKIYSTCYFILFQKNSLYLYALL